MPVSQLYITACATGDNSFTKLSQLNRRDELALYSTIESLNEDIKKLLTSASFPVSFRDPVPAVVT